MLYYIPDANVIRRNMLSAWIKFAQVTFVRIPVSKITFAVSYQFAV